MTKSSEPEITTVKMTSCLTFRSNKFLTTQFKFVKRTTHKKYGRHFWIRQLNCIKSTSIHNCHKMKLKSFSSSMVKSWKILHQIVLLNTLFTFYKQSITISIWVVKWLKLSLTFLRTFLIWSISCTFPQILSSKA